MISASLAQIVITTSDIPSHPPLDTPPTLIEALSTMTKQFDEFVQEIQRVEPKFLLDSTQRLCSIFDDLFSSLETLAKNDQETSWKQTLLVLCARLGEMNQEILRQIDEEFDSTTDYQEKLLLNAKSVANTTAVYVLKAKDIASHRNEQALINEIISSATQCALATSQLVACTKVI